MAETAAISASAAAMSRYERRLRTMTRALLFTDSHRSSLGLVAAQARAAAGGLLGAIFVRDAGGDEAILSPVRRVSAATVAALSADAPLAAQLLGEVSLEPRLIDVSSARLGPGMAWRFVGSRHTHGVLLVARKSGARPYVESDLHLLAPFAAEAGLAFTFTEAKHDLERGLLAKDRNRIARELHDGVIQSLYGIGMVLAGAKTEAFQPAIRDQLSAMTDSLNGVIDDIRAYINDLTPSRLARRGLGPELCSLANEFQAASGVITSVHVDDRIEEIDAGMGRDLVQIAREALYNVAKHAVASHALLTVRCTSDGVRLEVSDDGRGIRRGKRASGHGLANIARRAEAWGGTAEIGPASANGTVVRVLLPGRTAEGRSSGAVAIAG